MWGLCYKSGHDFSNQSPSPALAGNEVHDAITSVYSVEAVVLHVKGEPLRPTEDNQVCFGGP